MAGYEHVTFMLSLPRSRSAWMTEFMRPFVALALHNPLQQCATINELGEKIDAAPGGRVFVADVSAMFFFDELLLRFPGARYVVVHRPAREVELSMQRLGIHPPLNIRNAEKQLLDIAQSIRGRADTMTGTFFELNSPQIVRAISKFAAGVDVPYGYYLRMKDRNIQVSVADQIKRTDIAKQRVLFGKARIIH